MRETKIDLGVLAEYREKETDFNRKMSALNEALKARNAKKKAVENLKVERLKMFLDGFKVIASRLKEMYQVCTLTYSPLFFYHSSSYLPSSSSSSLSLSTASFLSISSSHHIPFSFRC